MVGKTLKNYGILKYCVFLFHGNFSRLFNFIIVRYGLHALPPPPPCLTGLSIHKLRERRAQ